MCKRSLFDIYFLNYRLFSSNTDNLIKILNELSKKDNRILTDIRTYKNGSIKNSKFDKNNWKNLINKIEGSKIEKININDLLGFKNDSERRRTEYQNKKYFVLDTILYNKDDIDNIDNIDNNENNENNENIENSETSNEVRTSENPVYKEITRIKTIDDGEERFLKTYNKNFKWNVEKSKKAKLKRLDINGNNFIDNTEILIKK